MFGLTKREQRWRAEQKAAETIIPLVVAALEANGLVETNERISYLNALNANQYARIELLERLLRRYRTEIPLGHQPHMIAHEVDEALTPNAEAVRPAVGGSEPAQVSTAS